MSENAIKLSHATIDFGKIIPGYICEEEITITNTTNSTLLIYIHVVCKNDEYEALDEYVYSVRKLTNYDYNEKLSVPIQASSSL